MEQERNVISVNLEKGRRETGGHEPSSDQKHFPVTGINLAGV
jgi:hypothetical protein